MAITTTTPAQRLKRLLNEGATILAVHPGQPGIDVTNDIVGLLEAARKPSEESRAVAEAASYLAV